MKKINFYFLITIAVLCCSCLGNLLNPDKLIGGTMSCTIDGKSWSASEASGLTLFGSVSITGLNGSGKNSSTILLAFDKEKAKAGTTIDLTESTENIGSSLSSYLTTINGVDTGYLISEGEIKITDVKGSKIEVT